MKGTISVCNEYVPFSCPSHPLTAAGSFLAQQRRQIFVLLFLTTPTQRVIEGGQEQKDNSNGMWSMGVRGKEMREETWNIEIQIRW